jgi:hypothetical protein
MCFVFSIDPYDACPELLYIHTKVMIDDNRRAIVQMASVSAIFPFDTGTCAVPLPVNTGNPQTALMGMGFSGYPVADADLVWSITRPIIKW